MTEWRQVDPPVANGGDVGGDIQATDSYSVRFQPVQQPAPGLHALVTVYLYGALARPGMQRPSCAPPTGWWVQQMTEYLVYRDPQDPGGSEEWSHYAYYDHPESYPDAESARKAAEGLARNVTPAICGGWGGQPWW